MPNLDVKSESDVSVSGQPVRSRILIISYLFPPAGGIGVQRALSLARYLPASGFEVHVLRASNAAAPVFDPALTKRVPASVQVHGSFTPEAPFWLRHTVWNWLSRKKKENPQSPSPVSTTPAVPASSQSGGLKSLATRMIRRVLSPEPEVLWYPFALRAASRVIRKYEIDTVMVTAPPFSAFLVGNALKRRFPHLKYVADFRDEWLSFYIKDFEYQSGDHARRRATEIERTTVESADLVVAVAATSLREIRGRYPELAESKFLCISNGFDPESFAGFSPQRNSGKKLVITHVGTAYKTSSPQFYLDALDTLPDQVRDNIETRFIGRITDAEQRQFENRKADIKLLGFMPQTDALRSMEDTDCLLVTMTNDISLPGKLYEYMAARKPVIALSPIGGEVDRFMQETGAGWCVDYRDKEGIQRLLTRLAEEKSRSGGCEQRIADAETIQRFARPRLVSDYAEAMTKLASS
ncbi:MAG TPA: glycosyltransferase [Candidatus Angelobacter sp.]|jgi:glycosyltransferase involved in cell wall biosynthesis